MSQDNKEIELVDTDNKEKPKSLNLDDVSNSDIQKSDVRWRSRYKETLSELESLKSVNDSSQKEIKQMSEKLVTFAQKRIDAEIKAAAVNAGLTDLDLIKLIDKEQIKIDDSGEPTGIEEAVNKFKEQKPIYFSEPKKVSSSTNAELVKNVAPVKTSAWNLSDEEFKKLEKSFTSSI